MSDEIEAGEGAQTDEEIELAKLEAEEAEQAAAEADEKVKALEAEAVEATGDELESNLAACKKAVDTKRKAVAKAELALKEAIAEEGRASDALLVVRPKMSITEVIAKHNREERERNLKRIAKGQPSEQPIDKVQVPGGPLQY